MTKQLRKKFFLICLAGGGLFAIAFFLTSGFTVGHSWLLALLCLGSGLFFTISFYFIWILLEKIQKPFTFENPKAQKKLLDYETIRNTSYECKFPAYMHYGKGLKQEMCETVLYVETEGIHIAFCHFGKIYSSDITYETIERAVFKQEDFLIIRVRESGNIVLSVKDSIPQLKELLAEKNICFEEYWEEKQ